VEEEGSGGPTSAGLRSPAAMHRRKELPARVAAATSPTNPQRHRDHLPVSIWWIGTRFVNPRRLGPGDPQYKTHEHRLDGEMGLETV
jgi:hypothetical protein